MQIVHVALEANEELTKAGDVRPDLTTRVDVNNVDVRFAGSGRELRRARIPALEIENGRKLACRRAEENQRIILATYFRVKAVPSSEDEQVCRCPCSRTYLESHRSCHARPPNAQRTEYPHRGRHNPVRSWSAHPTAIAAPMLEYRGSEDAQDARRS